MGNRERYQSEIGCKKCGTEGKATIDEIANPLFSKGRLDSKVIRVSDGFTHEGNKIHCEGCGDLVENYPSG